MLKITTSSLERNVVGKVIHRAEWLLFSGHFTYSRSKSVMNNLVLLFILTVYVKRYQSVSEYLIELRLTFQEQSVYFIIIL